MTAFVLALAIGSFFFALWGTSEISRRGWLQNLDYPNGRSLHVSPIPRTGGIVIVAGVLSAWGVAALGNSFLSTTPLWTRDVGWIAAMLAVIAVTSLWNDRSEIRPAIRFAVQMAAAASMVGAGDLQFEHLHLPLLAPIALLTFAVPVSVLFVVWMTNLFNFMDGLDGLAGGMVVFGFGSLALLALLGGNAPLAMLPLLVVAPAAGFLWHNFPPARVFMGDVGSTSLGFCAAALILLGVKHGTFDVWPPLLVFSPFIVDATLTLSRRLLRREKVWLPHREHYYQRLALSGWGHKRTACAEYVLMALCGLSGILYARVDDPVRLALLMTWALSYLVLTQVVNRIEALAPTPAT